MVDARLADGSRVNAIIPATCARRRLPLGPPFQPRPRHPARNMILKNHTLTEAMLELLSIMVKGRLNLLISGGTGAGKTTLLNVLSGYIPNVERIVTIEDAAELQTQARACRLRLGNPRPLTLKARAQCGSGNWSSIAHRVRAPTRIVVGEVRGEEAFDMLQAMNTGHEGSLTTVHANSVRDALARIENMVSMANLNIPERAIRHQISSAIHAVVQVARLSDGTRKVISISEVTGMDSELITMQDIFYFRDRHSIDENGKVRGTFRADNSVLYLPTVWRPEVRGLGRRCLNRKLTSRELSLQRILLEKIGRVLTRKADAAVGSIFPIAPTLSAMIARPFRAASQSSPICAMPSCNLTVHQFSGTADIEYGNV